jgi:hypothetical protein
MQLVPYSKSNKSCKRAAPVKTDGMRNQNLNAKPSYGDAPLFRPAFGMDYNYGIAYIKHCLKYRPNDVREPNEVAINPRGWVLPGGEFTQSPDRVIKVAQKMDRYMLAGGGLPKGWTEKMIAAQQMREAA